MKFGILLIVIGVIIAADGTIRLILGFVNGNPLGIIGGFLTGWLLGGFLLYKGITRVKKVQPPS